MERAIFTWFFILTICVATIDAKENEPQENKTQKKWTFLIFLNADNNLESAGYNDLQEMEKVGSTPEINVVVQFDPYSPQGTKRILIKKSLNEVSKGSFESPVVEDMPEQDMGDVRTLIDFAVWGMKKYPAEHYLLVLWNHGSGWSKQQEEHELFKSISYDDTSGNHIRTNELSDAIDEMINQTGTPIDVLGFDACLMSMYEVADSLSGMVDYLVASEETEPADGYPYDDLLKAFSKRKDKTPRELVYDMVRTYGVSYSNGSQGRMSITQSGLDLSKFELVKKRLNTWLKTLQENKVLKVVELLEAAQQTQSYADNYYRDLGDYVNRILNLLTQQEANLSPSLQRVGLPSPGATGASVALLKAIQEVVVENFNSANYSRSTGLSIYLPVGWGGYAWTTPSERKQAYLNLKWAKTTLWPQHLDKLFTSSP